MSQKRHNPFAPVLPVISQLASLTHDELRDLADMLEADAIAADDSTRRRIVRHGLPPVDAASGHTLILHGGWQYRTDPPLYTAPARTELRQAYDSTSTLPPEARALIAIVARMLRDAQAPAPERKRTADGAPLAEGSIEAKIIRRKVLNLDTGEIEIKPFGPYLYYRYWITGGDSDKRGKRLKNKYIGRQSLAQRFDNTPPGSEERRELERRIIAAFKAGTLDTLMLDMGLQRAETAPADDLGVLNESPNTQSDADDTPPELQHEKKIELAEAAPDMSHIADLPFLPDYAPAPTRKQVPLHFEMTDEQRDVLASVAAGFSSVDTADYQGGIHRRKIARTLADNGLLKEMSGDSQHRNHWWKLTEAGLKLVRRDEDLQRRLTQKMQ